MDRRRLAAGAGDRPRRRAGPVHHRLGRAPPGRVRRHPPGRRPRRSASGPTPSSTTWPPSWRPCRRRRPRLVPPRGRGRRVRLRRGRPGRDRRPGRRRPVGGARHPGPADRSRRVLGERVGRCAAGTRRWPRPRSAWSTPAGRATVTSTTSGGGWCSRLASGPQARAAGVRRTDHDVRARCWPGATSASASTATGPTSIARVVADEAAVGDGEQFSLFSVLQARTYRHERAAGGGVGDPAQGLLRTTSRSRTGTAWAGASSTRWPWPRPPWTTSWRRSPWPGCRWSTPGGWARSPTPTPRSPWSRSARRASRWTRPCSCPATPTSCGRRRR